MCGTPSPTTIATCRYLSRNVAAGHVQDVGRAAQPATKRRRRRHGMHAAPRPTASSCPCSPHCTPACSRSSPSKAVLLRPWAAAVVLRCRSASSHHLFPARPAPLPLSCHAQAYEPSYRWDPLYRLERSEFSRPSGLAVLHNLRKYAYDHSIDRFTRLRTEVLTVRQLPCGR